MMYPLRVLLVFTVFVPLIESQESGWSRFRGPNGSGISTSRGLPAAIGPKENVIWRTPLAPGHSSPVLWGDRIFITSAKEKKLLTTALDAKTGKVLWSRQVSPERPSKIDKRNHAAAASAAVDADIVVTFFNDFGMVAHDHEGQERWRVPLGPYNNEYGMGASPVLLGDRVFLACDQALGSYLLCVSKKDGRELWRTPRPVAGSGHCTPIFWTPEGGRTQLLLPGSFLLDAYDPETGERLWWVSGLSFEMKSVPVIHDGVLYINGFGSPLNNPGNQVEIPPFKEALALYDKNEDGLISKKEMPATRAAGYFGFCDRDQNGTHDAGDWGFMKAALASKNGLLAIKLGGQGDMTVTNVVWSYHRSIPQLPSPLVYGNLLYVLQDQGGFLTTLEPKTGKVVTRGRIEGGNDRYYASPVAADGKIFFVSLDGIASVLRIGGSFDVVAQHEFGERCYATPAIQGGRIYLRTSEAMYCFGKRD